jgi:transcriptional regulator
MYLPAAFREDRPAVLHDAIRAIRLATLVSRGAVEPFATHLPMVLDPAAGARGTLRGHIARANPHREILAGDGRALAIFLGPHAYVSPSYYATKAETGKVVPTWNYIAVHVYGRATLIENREALRRHVEALTDTHEAGRPTRWRVDDAPPDYVERMLDGIVGIALTVERIEGKWKVSQNRPAADRAGVVDGLETSDRADDRAIAAAVAAATEAG